MERAPNSPEKLPHLQNPKFLMPRDFTIAEVMNVIRGKISAAHENGFDKTTGLMLLAQGKYVPKQSDVLWNVYEAYRDADGFLYL